MLQELFQRVIDKAQSDKEAILRDIEYAKRVIILCENLANEYATCGDKDKAIDCLEKAVNLESILYGLESEEVNKTKRQIITLKQ